MTRRVPILAMEPAIEIALLVAIALMLADSARAASERPAWTPAHSGAEAWLALPPPSTRDQCTAIYDPVRDRMVIFGGDDHTFFPPRETWGLSLDGTPEWSYLNLGPFLPLARSGHTAIYDPLRDRMVIFGGYIPCTYKDCGRLNDVAALSLSGSSDWSPLGPEGTPPTGRVGHSAIHDPVRDRMIVFGGYDGGLRNDLWALSLSGNPTWSRIDPMGTLPPGRSFHTAIYDPVRDRMVVHGGGDQNSDVWTLSLDADPTWTRMSPGGTSPPERSAAAAVYDPVRDRMVLFGGVGDSGSRSDVWSLSLAGSPEWIELSPLGIPPSRAGHAAIYDPLRDRLVVFGGSHGFGGPAVNDTWALSLAGEPAWLQIEPGGPGHLADHSAIYDPLRDRMLIFGGSYYGNILDDLWALPLKGPSTWSQLETSGIRPPRRFGHVAIHDPVRDRMLIFGGWDGAYRNDVWALSLGNMTWTPLLCCGGPAPREQHTAIYDAQGDRMLVFGGRGAGTRFNDTWALSLAGGPAWVELGPEGTLPPARHGHTGVFDPLHDRMVIFGGFGDGGLLNDTWVLSLGETPSWSALSPEGFLPSGRVDHTAIYDPLNDRMVVYAGDSFGPSDEVWSLSLEGSVGWSPLAPTGYPPARRLEHSAVYDPEHERMVVFGGGLFSFNDVWALTWGSLVDVPAGLAPGTVHGILGVLPNPGRGPLVFEVRLTESQPDQALVIFDVQGRLVDRIVLRGLAAGVHNVRWAGTSRNGDRVSPGVYFTRLGAAPGSRTRRFVLID